MQNGAWRFRSVSKRQSLVLILIAMTIQNTEAIGNFSHLKCGDICNCSTTYNSKRDLYLQVECLKGNMSAIPTEDFKVSVIRLIIKPPTNRTNNFTIGPIFTQPKIFKQLRELFILHSNVPSIGWKSFKGLKNLRFLNLSFNKITRIGEHEFAELQHLIDLDLSHNHIQSMVSKTFHNCVFLRKLNLSYNNISVLPPRLFKMFQDLMKLDLSENPLKDLSPSTFVDLPHLTVFKCRNCKLSRINPYIYHLVPDLEELDLGYNQIAYVVIDDFPDLKKLLKLSLDGNQISVIVDNVFGENKRLKILNLAHNKLALLSPNSLKNLTNLTILDIGYNRLERFTLGTFSPVMRSLKKIDFSGNKIPSRELSVLLQVLPGIKNVSLANLSLTEIPPNFLMFNEHLTSLNLSLNKLTRFPLEAFSKNNQLRELDLSFNYLSSLQEPELELLEAIPFVHLLNNKWTCYQCSVGTMLVYMNTTVLNQTLRELRCYEPIQLRGNALANIRLETLDVCGPSHEAQVSVIVALVLVLVLVLALALVAVAFSFTRRRAQQRYYNQEQKHRERNHEHPEELLPHTELSSLATIESLYHAPCEQS